MEKATISYKHGFEDGDDHQMYLRGYRSDVLVTLPSGVMYELSFFDPVRLKQEVDEYGYVAEKNLIVIKDVTPAMIEETVQKLMNDRFFEDLSPFV